MPWTLVRGSKHTFFSVALQSLLCRNPKYLLWQALWQQERTLQQTLKAAQPQIPLAPWPKTWLHRRQLEDLKTPQAQNPLIGGLRMRWWNNGG